MLCYLYGFWRHKVESSNEVVLGDVGFVVTNGRCDSEVDEFEESTGDQEVGRLQVRVNDALAMDHLKSNTHQIDS